MVICWLWRLRIRHLEILYYYRMKQTSIPIPNQYYGMLKCSILQCCLHVRKLEKLPLQRRIISVKVGKTCMSLRGCHGNVKNCRQTESPQKKCQGAIGEEWTVTESLTIAELCQIPATGRTFTSIQISNTLSCINVLILREPSPTLLSLTILYPAIWLDILCFKN